MSILSANTLFHFTKQKSSLLSILETGFRPSYSREFGQSMNGRLKECHIPMVCFCDLPLSNIDKHINGHSWAYEESKQEFSGYGKFGLGMTKEWGIVYKLNPVSYTTNNSHNLEAILDANNTLLMMFRHFDEEVQNIIEVKGGEAEDIESYNDSELEKVYTLLNIQRVLTANGAALNHTKPYQDIKTGLRYYDEREWRFVVPGTYKSGHDAPVIFSDSFPDQIQKKPKYEEAIIKNHMLIFRPKDVKYIIVERDQDIDDVIDRMKSLPEKYTSEDVSRLTTRIMTCEQIHEDF